MSNIIDLSTLNRKGARREEKAKKKLARRIRTKPEFIQVCATTIGQCLQLIQWSLSKTVDTDHLKFLGDVCNYQLRCFARAYGWTVEPIESVPVRFEMSITTLPDEGKVATDFSIEGELGGPVSAILSAVNPELELTAIDEDPGA
jgi:hypothetical protein